MAGDFWEEKAKRALRCEMVRKGFTYGDLRDALEQIGVRDNVANLRNKVARGTFSATLFLQCMAALGVKELRLD